MSKPKRINMTYIGDGRKRIGGTYTADSEVVHALDEDDEDISLCGNDLWSSYSDRYDRNTNGKIEDVTCKKCLQSINSGKIGD